MEKPSAGYGDFASAHAASPFGTVTGFRETETVFPASTPVHMFRAKEPSPHKANVAPVHSAEDTRGEAETT